MGSLPVRGFSPARVYRLSDVLAPVGIRIGDMDEAWRFKRGVEPRPEIVDRSGRAPVVAIWRGELGLPLGRESDGREWAVADLPRSTDSFEPRPGLSPRGLSCAGAFSTENGRRHITNATIICPVSGLWTRFSVCMNMTLPSPDEPEPYRVC